MFLRVSLRYNIIVEGKWWINIISYLPTKYNSLSLFINIWIEIHFPLKSPTADFSKIIIQFPGGYIHIMTWEIENKDVLSVNSLTFDDKLSDLSLI